MDLFSWTINSVKLYLKSFNKTFYKHCLFFFKAGIHVCLHISLRISLHTVSLESKLVRSWMHRQQISTEFVKGFCLWKRVAFFKLWADLDSPPPNVGECSNSFYHSMWPVRVPSLQVILSCLFLASLKFKQSSLFLFLFVYWYCWIISKTSKQL